nr:hypothetical protein [Candidatus Anoxychlamydiales bacterium]
YALLAPGPGMFFISIHFPGKFLNFKQTLPPGTKAPDFRVGEE